MQSRSQRARCFGYAIFGLCLFVLLFAAQLKLSQYRSPSTTPDPVTASKLWLQNQKMELPAAGPLPLLLICLASLFAATLAVAAKSWPYPQAEVAVVRRRELFEPRRFQRPPPSV